MTDWRLRGQERYLFGVTLSKSTYRQRCERWGHDHCEFCWRKFSAREGDLREGYSTQDEYHWICEQCFADFRDRFQWRVESVSR